jgi:Threonyl-tRNA synthetase
VRTPHIARESLYKKSGHLPYYGESMFPPMELQAEGELQIRITEDRAMRRAQSKELAEKMGLAAANFKELRTPEAMLAYLREAIKTQSPENQERIRQIGDNEVVTRLATAFMPDPERYYLKAMNCPHHHKLFAALPRSYRDCRCGLAEYGTDYRYEKSGELFGLCGCARCR